MLAPPRRDGGAVGGETGGIETADELKQELVTLRGARNRCEKRLLPCFEGDSATLNRVNVERDLVSISRLIEHHSLGP